MQSLFESPEIIRVVNLGATKVGNTLQIYTVENGTHVKGKKVTSICCRCYYVEV